MLELGKLQSGKLCKQTCHGKTKTRMMTQKRKGVTCSTFRQARGSELLPGAAHHRCQIDDEGPAAQSGRGVTPAVAYLNVSQNS